MRLAFAPYELKFYSPAGTSRGVLTDKLTYFIKIWDPSNPEIFGIGEAPLFKGISADDVPGYEYKLIELLANMALGRPTDLLRFPSIQFGLEQAIRDFSSGGKGVYFPSAFTEGRDSVLINGLIWMGSKEEMLERIEEKLSQGFQCIKMKIGGISWEREVEIISDLRRRYSANQLCIRVDANGSFNMDNALPRLKRLADMEVHSIEQPIPAGYPDLMAFLCSVSPLPIALDEELIGKFTRSEKRELLQTVMPRYIILKPALCGGFSGAAEWIELAREYGIDWWVTSALESNVGLNALAQWTASMRPEMPQGLGTGMLFTNNFPSPLHLQGERLMYDPDAATDRHIFDTLDWRM